MTEETLLVLNPSLCLSVFVYTESHMHISECIYGTGSDIIAPSNQVAKGAGTQKKDQKKMSVSVTAGSADITILLRWRGLLAK